MKKSILLILAITTNLLVKTQENPQMILVEGGTFVMDETLCYGNNKHQNKITLESFKIAKTEVTKAQWNIYKPRTFDSDYDNDDDPAQRISFFDAIEYCKWLSKKTGKYYRLPTEAEWEFAARGGNKSKGFKYAGGNDLNTVAWWHDNSNTNPNPHAIHQHSVHKVGAKKPNELGLYDMTGNVAEWCYYHCSTQYNEKILRGGYYYSYNNCFINKREYSSLGSSDGSTGFRVIQVISKKELEFHTNEIKKSLE